MPTIDPTKVEFEDTGPAAPSIHVQEALSRQRQREIAARLKTEECLRRSRRLDLLVKLPAVLVFLGAIGMAAADYTGLYAPFHLFPHHAAEAAPAAPVPTLAQAQEAQAASMHADPAPAPVVLHSDPAPVPAATAAPQDQPDAVAAPAVDPAVLSRLSDRVKACQRGALSIAKDLAERQQRIRAEDIALLGTYATTDGSRRNPDGYAQQLQKAQALNASLPANLNANDRQKMDTVLHNAVANVSNTQRSIAEDQDVERSLSSRLAKAQADLTAAQQAYQDAGGQ